MEAVEIRCKHGGIQKPRLRRAEGIKPTTIGIYVCMDFMALITAMVLCASCKDSLLSVSVHRFMLYS